MAFADLPKHQDGATRRLLGAHIFDRVCSENAIEDRLTKPYHPWTHGQAERFIQTSIREWAYAQPFQSSAERARARHPGLHDYHTVRQHAAQKGKPPLSRLPKDNLLGRDS